MKFKSSLLATALVVAAAAPAHANVSSLVVNLAGWQTFGDFGDPANSFAFYTLPAGSVVTGFDYSGLTFLSNGSSWTSELVLSVNNFTGAPVTIDEFMDWAPSTATSSGSFGPVSGSWGGPTGDEGPYGAGGAFTVGEGADNVFVTVYESFPDGASPDAVISAGTLTIHFTAPIPEPATYGLMALGLVGVGAIVRRRKTAA